uniref:HTH_48 domain-containing protein n=1 Tax=Panagrellus redivivus TaxID=6233 RepID=A0A7E4VEX3_PANRE
MDNESGSEKRHTTQARILLTDARVLYYVDAFVLRKQFGSDVPFDCTQVDNLRRLAESISAVFPNSKPVSRTTVQYWYQKREELRAEGKISKTYWQALNEELCRKWPLTTASKADRCSDDIPPPFDANLSLPAPKITSRSLSLGAPTSIYHFGYTDKCGDKTLCYNYDEFNPDRVKVYHLNRADLQDSTGVSYYKCSTCKGRAQVNISGLFVSPTHPHEDDCIGLDRKQFDCDQCIRYAKVLIRRGVSKVNAHGIAQDRAITLNCFDKLFPPYAILAKTYSNVEGTRKIDEPVTLKTGERWLLHKYDTMRVYATDAMLQTLATYFNNQWINKLCDRWC